MQTSAVRQQGSKVFGTAAHNAAAMYQPRRNKLTPGRCRSRGKRDHPMAFKRGEQIIETAQKPRQAERGPSVRNVLVASTALAIIALGIVWLVFFRT
jgi:hypothetical protein